MNTLLDKDLPEAPAAPGTPPKKDIHGPDPGYSRRAPFFVLIAFLPLLPVLLVYATGCASYLFILVAAQPRGLTAGRLFANLLLMAITGGIVFLVPYACYRLLRVVNQWWERGLILLAAWEILLLTSAFLLSGAMVGISQDVVEGLAGRAVIYRDIANMTFGLFGSPLTQIPLLAWVVLATLILQHWTMVRTDA